MKTVDTILSASDIFPHEFVKATVTGGDVTVPVDQYRVVFFEIRDGSAVLTGTCDEHNEEFEVDAADLADLAAQAEAAWYGDEDEDDDPEPRCCGGANRYCPCTPRGLGREL